MSAAAMPSYATIIQQLMGSPPPPSAGMFGKNAVQGFESAMDAANQSNYQRGSGILQLLAQQGASSKADNADLFKQENANIDESMMDKGLSNLTVGDTLHAGATRDLARANQRVDEGVAGNLASMANGFTVKGPDPSFFASLLAGRNVQGGGIVNPPQGGSGFFRSF